MLAGRVTGPLVKLVGLIHEYQQVALSVKMLGAVMNTPTEPNMGRVRAPLRGGIAFENVSFRYRADLPLAIRHFSLEIPPGGSLGIVGRSGSGKTTLTKLLQGLYPPFSGLVKIDGIDIREIEKSHLRSSIGVVLQENYFFQGTVRENICLARPAATAEEMLRAAALLHDCTKEYDTAHTLALLSQAGISLRADEQSTPAIWHAITAPIEITRSYPAFATPALLSAVRWHTTGHAGMTVCEAILYLADVIEAGREYPACVALRAQFWGADPAGMPPDARRAHLADAVLASLQGVRESLLRKGQPVCADTLAAIADLTTKKTF
jgi:hypothetical protein